MNFFEGKGLLPHEVALIKGLVDLMTEYLQSQRKPLPVVVQVPVLPRPAVVVESSSSSSEEEYKDESFIDDSDPVVYSKKVMDEASKKYHTHLDRASRRKKLKRRRPASPSSSEEEDSGIDLMEEADAIPEHDQTACRHFFKALRDSRDSMDLFQSDAWFYNRYMQFINAIATQIGRDGANDRARQNWELIINSTMCGSVPSIDPIPLIQDRCCLCDMKKQCAFNMHLYDVPETKEPIGAKCASLAAALGQFFSVVYETRCLSTIRGKEDEVIHQLDMAMAAIQSAHAGKRFSKK